MVSLRHSLISSQPMEMNTYKYLYGILVDWLIVHHIAHRTHRTKWSGLFESSHSRRSISWRFSAIWCFNTHGLFFQGSRIVSEKIRLTRIYLTNLIISLIGNERNFRWFFCIYNSDSLKITKIFYSQSLS